MTNRIMCGIVLIYIRSTVGSIVLDIVYGYEALPKDDKWIALADGIVHAMGAAAR